MSIAHLPKDCDIDALAEQLADAGALGTDWQSLVIMFPPEFAVHCSALTFLCAWGRQQIHEGRRLLFRGDRVTVDNLARLGLHEHLGLAFDHVQQVEPDDLLVPLRLISNEQDLARAALAIKHLVNQHFANASAFLPALEWAVNEILDNVARHAEAKEPGAVYAEYAERQHRLEVSICDLGCGIYASLGATTFLRSHGHAITESVRRGVTRSEDIGQGNGLAGVREIVTRNRGDLRIWTGDALFRVVGGVDKGFVQIPSLPGTGVALSLDTRRPVDLRETWIASQSPGFVGMGTQTGVDDRWLKVAEPRELSSMAQRSAAHCIRIAEACETTGMRAPAERLRQLLLRRLAQETAPLTLDFEGVENATSSFLDELLGRLAAELGTQAFRSRLHIVGMSDLVERMASVVIAQRLECLPRGPRDGTEP